MKTTMSCLGIALLFVLGCGKPAAPTAAKQAPVRTVAQADDKAASPANEQAVKKLIGDLHSDKAPVRVAAADALGAMGAKAKAAVPDLIGALADKDSWAGLAASEALGTIGEPALPAVVQAMESGEDLARVRAGLAIRGMGVAAKPALPALRKALEDKNPRLRELAAQCIEEIESGRPHTASGASHGDATHGDTPHRSRLAATRPAALQPAADQGASGDWPGFRGPRRDGLCLETGLLASWPSDGPKLLWKMEGLGKGYSSVAIAGGRLFTMGDRPDDGKNAQFVLAFDLASRKEIWATRVGPPHSDGPRCTPTIDGELLYALGTEGDLVCLETATGKERWRKSLVKDFGGRMMSGWKFSESPLVDGDKLICTPGASDAALVALNKKTGEVIWKCKTSDLGEKGKDGAAYCSAVAAEIDGVRQYVQIMGRGAVGVAAQDGKLLWNYNRIANGVANVPSPLVRGNQVFVTTSYKTGAALLKIAGKDGKFSAEEIYFLEPTQFENHHGGVVLVGDYLYGGHGLNAGQPACIHVPTGEIVWKPKAPYRGSAAVLYADGHLIFRYDRGEVCWIEANPQEFRPQGQFKAVTADGPAWAYPVVHDKRLYLRHGNVLACYDLSAK